MLSKVLPINPLPSSIVAQLQKFDDFFVCPKFTENMVGSSIVKIGENVYYRFMNFIYLPQPPESLTAEQIKRICDVRLKYIDGLVNYQINSSVVDSIVRCIGAKFVSTNSPIKVVDFGCGSGLSSQLLIDRIPNLDLIGVDISEKAITSCQKLGIEAILTQPEEPLPFESASFDLILAVFVMHFNIDMLILKELCRVLRPEGLFVFNIYQRDIDGLAVQLDEAGFCSIDIWERLSKVENSHIVMSCGK